MVSTKNGSEPLGKTVSTLKKEVDDLRKELEAMKTGNLESAGYELQRKAVSIGQNLDNKEYNHIHVRSFASDAEHNKAAELQGHRWVNVRPDSVLVCGMSFHWSGEGYSWNKVCDMIEHTQAAGHYVGFSEMQDRCMEPYDALGTMRNEAALMALNEGFEWICYLDNDIQPEPDTLTRLLQHQQSIVAPYVVEPGTGRHLFSPPTAPNQGLIPAKWTVLSMLLFRTNVFRCVGPNFWRDAVGADEGFHYQHLWYYGHRPFVDTDIQLVVGGAPHYPLSSNRLSQAERSQLWDEVNQKRNNPPDRRPMNPDGPHVHDGQYIPWRAEKSDQSEPESSPNDVSTMSGETDDVLDELTADLR